MQGKTSLLKASSFLFTGIMVSNFCNYLFQVLMGRLLSVEDYGIMNSLIALFMITAIPSLTISMVVAKYTSQFKAQGEEQNINIIFYSFMKTVLVGVSAGFLVFLFLSPHTSAYLNIPSVTPTIILGMGLFIGFMNSVNIGALQGLHHFRFLSISMGAGSVLKLLFAFILLYLGFRVNGVIAAIPLATLAVYCLSFLYLRKKRDILPLSQTRLLKLEDRNEILKYSLPILFATVIFSVITQVDMMLVKHYFPPQQAGIYASAAVLGRAVLYLPAAIVIAFFPMVTRLHSLNQDTFQILRKGLIYTGSLAGTAVLFFLAFPEFLLGILFGRRYLPAVPLLGMFGLAMFPLPMLGILINFNLARHQVKFIYTLLFAAIVQIGLIHFYHQSLSQVLWIMAGMGMFLFVTNLGMVLWEKSSMAQA